jgi:hypothetical protein
MNISSGVLWAVLGALYLPGDPVGLASEATLHGDLAFLGPKGSYSDEAASKYISRAHHTGLHWSSTHHMERISVKFRTSFALSAHC